jgi:hypothetical protein
MLKIGNYGYTEFEIEDLISHDGNVIYCSDNTKVIRYLGAPLDMRKLSKMKWCEIMLNKMYNKATKIAES